MKPVLRMKKIKKITLTKKQLQTMINKAVNKAVKRERKIFEHEKAVVEKAIEKRKQKLNIHEVKKAETEAKEMVKHKSTKKKYDTFHIIFSAIKQHHVGSDIANDTDIFETETFVREYPVSPKLTLAQFKKAYIPDVINDELVVFEKIAEDQDYGVHWSNWTYEVRAGEREED